VREGKTEGKEERIFVTVATSGGLQREMREGMTHAVSTCMSSSISTSDSGSQNSLLEVCAFLADRGNTIVSRILFFASDSDADSERRRFFVVENVRLLSRSSFFICSCNVNFFFFLFFFSKIFKQRSQISVLNQQNGEIRAL
jgi:hypothetical protein